MDIKKIIDSDRAAIVMSIILGLGVATIFRKICTEKDCVIFEPPSKDFLTKGILKYDNKCYQNETQHVRCDKNKKKVRFKTSWLW